MRCRLLYGPWNDLQVLVVSRKASREGGTGVRRGHVEPERRHIKFAERRHQAHPSQTHDQSLHHTQRSPAPQRPPCVPPLAGRQLSLPSPGPVRFELGRASARAGVFAERAVALSTVSSQSSRSHQPPATQHPTPALTRQSAALRGHPSSHRSTRPRPKDPPLGRASPKTRTAGPPSERNRLRSLCEERRGGGAGSRTRVRE